MKKNKANVTPGMVIIYVFLCVRAVIYLAPLIWVFLVSFKTNVEIFNNPFGTPEVIQLGNYIVAWTAGKLGIATLNSAIVCGITLVLTMVIGSMAAFAIGRLRWTHVSVSWPVCAY